MGRGFTPEDERWGSHRVVVLTDGLWRRRFGGDTAILGRVVSLNALPYVVVGVLPPKTSFLGINAELFAPMAFEPGDNLNTHNNYFLTMVGREKPGATRAQALADINGIMDGIKRQYPENSGLAVDVTPLRDALVGAVRPAVLVLMGAVAFVLLIACVNVANLLLARALGRRREIAIRAALGAGRRRLLRQFLTEGVLLAALGGVFGLILASWGVEALHKVSTLVLPRADEIRLDPVVMAFTLGLSVVTGLLFGAAPALHGAGLFLQDALKEGTRSTDGAGRRGGLRGSLVVAEIALSLVLLIGAGLMIKSVHRLLQVDSGFEARRVLTAQIALPEQKYIDAERARAFSPEATARASQFFDSVIGRLRALPGVRAAGAVSGLPLAGENWGKSVTFYDRPLPSNARDLPPIQSRVVAGDYFRALNIRLLQGRPFNDRDTLHAPLVAIVNAELVRRYWKGESPIGKTLSVNPPRELVPEGTLPPSYTGPQKFTVVGVAADVRDGGLDRTPPPLV
jgi:putative ABC transport system permease protein